MSQQMEFEESEQLKETTGSHLEFTFHARNSFRKVGGYGAKRLWRLEDAEPEFPIPEDGGLESEVPDSEDRDSGESPSLGDPRT